MLPRDTTKCHACLGLVIWQVSPRGVKPSVTINHHLSNSHEDGFDGIIASPSRCGEQLQTNRATDGHVARVESKARSDDAHKGWCGGETRAEAQLKLHRRTHVEPDTMVFEGSSELRAFWDHHLDSPAECIRLIGKRDRHIRSGRRALVGHLKRRERCDSTCECSGRHVRGGRGYCSSEGRGRRAVGGRDCSSSSSGRCGGGSEGRSRRA
mmetsp:Transcript_736/g.1997  ORF Transcript_736/g.1997 Transcript_736/m.1997 type:complete len:210 (+) Transcript_736:139-768(+)